MKNTKYYNYFLGALLLPLVSMSNASACSPLEVLVEGNLNIYYEYCADSISIDAPSDTIAPYWKNCNENESTGTRSGV